MGGGGRRERAAGAGARLSGTRCPGASKADMVADAWCKAVSFPAVGWGLRDGGLGLWAALLGLVAGVAVATILLLVMRFESQSGARAGELGGAAGFDPDDAILLVPLLIWLGFSQAMIVAAAVGAPAFAPFMATKFRSGPHDPAA